MKVLLATVKPFAKVAVDGIQKILTEAGHEVVILEKYPDEAALIAAVADADAMIVRSDKVTKAVLEGAKKLKLVVRAGSGVDAIDLPAATSKGVVVMNTPGQNSNAVGELVAAMMIYMSRNQFNGTSGIEVTGRKFGLQAFGNAARKAADKAKGLEMEVYAVDPYLTDDKIAAEGVKPLHSLDELYSTCQFVSLHIPATPETIKSIGYDLMMKMPKGGVLINAARGEVVDDEGIEKAMEEREDLKYITDIAPSNADRMREKFGARFFATPKKMGAQTAEANINAGLAAARQIVEYFKSGSTRFQVNK